MHLTKEQIALYRTGKLPDADAYLAVDAHVKECPTCRARLCRPAIRAPHFSARSLATVLDSAAFLSDHPESGVLVDFARRPRGVAAEEAAHIRICRRCMEDVIALRNSSAERSGLLRALTALFPSRREGDAQTRRRSWVARPAGRWVMAGALTVIVLAAYLLRPGRVVLEIDDAGGRWALHRNGKLTSPGTLPPSLQVLVEGALRDGIMQTPAELASLAGTSDVLVSPVATVILSEKPTLSWKAYPGAEGYLCTVTSPDNPAFKIASSEKKPVRTTSWQIKAKSLPRGKRYTWQVEAVMKNGEHKPLTPDTSRLPKFKVLDQAGADEVVANLKMTGGSHLVNGLLYAEFGMLDDAEREFVALQLQNPNSETVKRLVRRLAARRRVGA